MARAPEFNPFDASELDCAREFVRKNLASAMGVKLEADTQGRKLLVNPASGATYAVYLTSVANSYVGVLYKGGAAPLGCEEADWQIVLEATGSMAHVFHQKSIAAAMAHAAGGGVVHGFVGGSAEGGHTYAAFAAAADGSLGTNAFGHRSFPLRKPVPYMAYRKVNRASREDFVHLHVHSMYSMLDGVSSIEGIPQTALENGQPGIALTDHGYMFGTFKFFKACKERGVKPIVGVEAYIVDDVDRKYTDAAGNVRRFEYHQTILASTQAGWENLCELMSTACRDHFYYVPRIDRKLLFKHNEGLIVLSGCFKGMVAWHLQQYGSDVGNDLPWYRHDPDRSRTIMREFKKVFGDRYYAELQAIDFDRYMQAMPLIAQMAADEGVPAVVTNDCHYEKEEDAIFQSVLSRISTSKVGDGIGDEMRRKGVYFIKPASQMQHPVLSADMFSRTCEIMERCNVDLDAKGYLFPEYKMQEDPDWAAYEAQRGVA